MVGSGYFVKNPPVPLEQIKVNINLDMVGRPDGIMTELGVVGANQIEPGLKELIYAMNDQTSMLILDSIDSRNYFRRSDQYSYFRAGIPSVLLTTGEHGEYHTPRDDPEKIDHAFLEKVCLLTYEVIMVLANEEADPFWQ
jgi:Zn-dependent M28 family amino/carboxypeptidase